MTSVVNLFSNIWSSGLKQVSLIGTLILLTERGYHGIGFLEKLPTTSRSQLIRRNNTLLGIIVVGSCTFVVFSVCDILKQASLLSRSSSKIIPGPGRTISSIPEDDQGSLPYPPDAFPGARDIDCPYGTIRVYEFGPDTGRKVLLLNGISTPCIAFHDLAHGLVSQGCRVLLMDFLGRGYSDGIDTPHDSRLYTSQILLAVTSSPVAWTPDGFNLIGYSMGGAIAADFTANFPSLVTSLVLMAPGGLIRPQHFNWSSRILFFTDLLPDWAVEWIMRRRLEREVRGTRDGVVVDAEIPRTSNQLAGTQDPVFEDTLISPRGRPGVTIGDVVDWQLMNHAGFVKSFVSSMRYAPIMKREETWRKLRMREDKVLIVIGSTDSIILADELYEDATACIGEENVEWRVVDCGHEFPIKEAPECLKILEDFWK